MRSVVTFWQLPEDEDEFLGFLLTTGKIVAMPWHWAKRLEELSPQPLVPYIKQHDPDQLRLGLEEYARRADIEPQEHDGEKYFSIAPMSPCLICYSRGKLRDDNKLIKSNLFAYWDYPNEKATELIRKDPEFIEWAKRVFNWVRRFAPRQVEYNGSLCRTTNRAKDAIQAGRLELVPY
jgi:hypothetical protein